MVDKNYIHTTSRFMSNHKKDHRDGKNTSACAESNYCNFTVRCAKLTLEETMSTGNVGVSECEKIYWS